MMTVSEFMKQFEHSDPEEPLNFEIIHNSGKSPLYFNGTYSQAGGRATLVAFTLYHKKRDVILPSPVEDGDIEQEESYGTVGTG